MYHHHHQFRASQRLPQLRSPSPGKPTLGSTVVTRDLGDDANVVYCTARLGSKREDVPVAVVGDSALRAQVTLHIRSPVVVVVAIGSS